MIKNNKNKGFSFIELIIVVAILSIVMIMVSRFMTSTLNTYTRTNADNKVQSNAQETYDKIANHVMMAQAVKISVTKLEVDNVIQKSTISTGAIISTSTSPGTIFMGVNEVGKDIDETCTHEDDEIYVDANSGLIRYKTASGSMPVLSVNGKSVFAFKSIDSTEIEKNSVTDVMTATITKATLTTQAINILYEDNERYYVAKYRFKKPTDANSHDGALYLTIEDTGLMLADEFAGTEAEQLVYRKAKLSAAGSIEDPFVFNDDNLLSKGVEKFIIVTDGNGNSLGVDIEFYNKDMKYKSKGMITIRNSNVLSKQAKQ